MKSKPNSIVYFLVNSADLIIFFGLIIFASSVGVFGGYVSSVVYVGPFGNFQSTGMSELGITAGTVILAIGVAGKILGAKNTFFEATKNRLRFRTK